MSASFVVRSTLAAAALALCACGGQSEEAIAEDTPAAADVETAQSDSLHRSAIETPTDMAMGDPNAPVTIIEYASATCSHCATFHEGVFKDLKAKYIDTGQVRYVFREFPLDPLAAAGFLLARCVAADHGSEGYFTFIDALFRKQQVWAFGEDPRTELMKIANEAGVDGQEFDACVQDQTQIDRIRAEMETAQTQFEIKGTPSFIINGETLGLRTLEQFDEALAPLLPAE